MDLSIKIKFGNDKKSIFEKIVKIPEYVMKESTVEDIAANSAKWANHMMTTYIDIEANDPQTVLDELALAKKDKSVSMSNTDLFEKMFGIKALTEKEIEEMKAKKKEEQEEIAKSITGKSFFEIIRTHINRYTKEVNKNEYPFIYKAWICNFLVDHELVLEGWPIKGSVEKYVDATEIKEIVDESLLDFEICEFIEVNEKFIELIAHGSWQIPKKVKISVKDGKVLLEDFGTVEETIQGVTDQVFLKKVFDDEVPEEIKYEEHPEMVKIKEFC